MKTNLGAIERSYDNRDIHLAQIQMPVDFPTQYSTDISGIKHLFQNGFGTCTAHAGCHLKEILEKYDSGNIALSPRFLWRKEKDIDGYPLDVGSDLRAILKSLASQGTCSYDLLPNVSKEEGATLESYSVPVLTQDMADNAQLNIIKSYAFLPKGFTPDDLKRAIYLNKAVVVAFRCDDGLFGTNIPTFTTKKYGHMVCFYGYDEQNFYFIDSTERDDRYALKTFKNIYFPFIFDAGTAVDIPNEEIRKLIVKKNLLTKILELYKQLKMLIK